MYELQVAAEAPRVNVMVAYYWHGMVWLLPIGMAWYGWLLLVWCGVVGYYWHGMVWFATVGMVWYGCLLLAWHSMVS